MLTSGRKDPSGLKHALAKARAEIERLTKERDHARSMLADAERDMRQRAADYLQSAVDDWRSDGHEHAAKKIEDEIPGVLALPLKHADRENDAAFAQGQKEGAER